MGGVALGRRGRREGKGKKEGWEVGEKTGLGELRERGKNPLWGLLLQVPAGKGVRAGDT